MSDELSRSSKGVKTPGPNRWPRVVIGFLLSCSVAAVCAVLFARYVESRPVNLRDHTAALVDIVSQVLVRNRVPVDRIHRDEPQPRSDHAASWSACAFEVELPAGITGEGLIAPITEAMSAYSVTVVEASNTGLEHALDLSLADHPFLTIRLKEKARTDLTAASKQIAEDLRAILQTQGVPPEEIQGTPPEPREDDHAVWTFTRIEAPLPASCTVESIEPLIQGALTEENVRVATRIGTHGATTLAVTCADVLCAELILNREALDAAPGEDELAGLALPALHGLNGNEPALPDLEHLPLDSAGLDDLELGRKLTGIRFPMDTAPKVAIIVDDGGYDGNIASKLLALNSGLTLAILPNTPLAADTARRASELGFCVMLHMPMEIANMPGQITTRMTREQILERTNHALAQLPEAVGVNNHMGSVFTADAAAMTTFLECIKDKPLFFIDSRTTSRSKAYETAKKIGIPTACRDVFLDHRNDPNYIIAQFNHLMAVAKEQGRAIGICHFRPNTVQVLAQMLPQLERNGIKLVHASELAPGFASGVSGLETSGRQASTPTPQSQ
jgi:hypothetical protein